MFQETQDTENFQVRSVFGIHGQGQSYPAVQAYNTTFRQRRQVEAVALADMTGWQLDEIYRKEGIDPAGMTKPAQRWQGLWK